MRRTRMAAQRKRRDKRRKTWITRSLQSGMVLSSLFVGLSHQTGITYGNFNSFQETNGELAICSIFPSDLEALLTRLSDVLAQAGLQREQLQLNAVMDYDMPDAALSSVFAASSGSSLEEMKAAEAGLDAQREGLLNRLDMLNARLAANDAAWMELQQLAGSAAGLLQELMQAVRDNQPNCTEIRQSAELDAVSAQMNRKPLLSGSLSAAIQSLLAYLREVQAAGSRTEGDPDALEAFLQDSGSPLAKAYSLLEPGDLVGNQPLNETLISHNQQITSQLESGISAINGQLSDIGAKISALRAAIETEQARLEEHARLEEQARLEKLAQQEKEEGDPALKPEADPTDPSASDQAPDPTSDPSASDPSSDSSAVDPADSDQPAPDQASDTASDPADPDQSASDTASDPVPDSTSDQTSDSPVSDPSVSDPSPSAPPASESEPSSSAPAEAVPAEPAAPAPAAADENIGSSPEASSSPETETPAAPSP